MTVARSGWALLGALAALAPARAETIVAGVPLSSSLAEGSEVAAGLDPNAGEIAHPAVRTDVAAALRNLGGVWSQGQGSAALQLNPYFVFAGADKLYKDATAFRALAGGLGALVEDASIAGAITIGTPFDDATRTSARFSTVGLGASVELLGQRSFYSKAYSSCLRGADAYKQAVVGLAVPAAPATPQAMAEFQRNLDTVAKKVGDHVAACDAQVFDTSTALFLSGGGRWVTPGPQHQPGDGIRIQRSFAALTLDQLVKGNLGISLQARVIGARPTIDAAVDTNVDLGVSVRYVGHRVQLQVEWDDTASSGATGPTATFSSRLLVAVTDEIGLELAAKGTGANAAEAIKSIVPGVTVSYQKKQVAHLDI